ncbi:MAG: hypothetical protein GY801_03905 [bacterium]|nr:hypothetical protein [bacterium]
MLLLDIEEQIKPLSRPEKRKLFDFLAMELDIHLPAFQTAQADRSGFQPDAEYPIWSQYEAYGAAKDLEDALSAADLPIL